MSRLQERAKPYVLPLVLGEATALGAAAQGIVAAWIAMTITVAEYFDPSKAAVSPTQRRYPAGTKRFLQTGRSGSDTMCAETGVRT